MAVQDGSRIAPQNVRAFEGDEVIFLCASVKHTKWYFSSDDSMINPNVIASNTKNISIWPITMLYDGYIFCFGTSTVENTYFIAKTRLRVYGRFTLTIKMDREAIYSQIM